MGGGKGKGKGFKGKGFKGAGFSPALQPRGPLIEALPLYPGSSCSVREAPFPLPEEDVALVKYHRRLVHFWRSSPYFVQLPFGTAPRGSRGSGSSRNAAPGEGAANRPLSCEQAVIAASGPMYYPAELFSIRRPVEAGPSRLENRKGNATDALEVFKRMESKEGLKGKQSAEDVEGKEEPPLAEEDEEEEEIGDEDYVQQYGDFEDGTMDGDYDDDGGGGGGGDGEMF